MLACLYYSIALISECKLDKDPFVFPLDDRNIVVGNCGNIRRCVALLVGVEVANSRVPIAVGFSFNSDAIAARDYSAIIVANESCC